MGRHRYAAPCGGRALHARGPWARRRRGGILPYLAAAFLTRAALRRWRHGGGPGSAPWAEDQWYGPYGARGHGRPWGRGGWHRGHEHGPGRGPAWALRSEISPLVGLLRDAFRRGALDDRQVDEIRAVLRESLRRIAAILDETRPSSTEL
jgi:hypothetical protein